MWAILGVVGVEARGALLELARQRAESAMLLEALKQMVLSSRNLPSRHGTSFCEY
jgi:hypothetical protein